MDPFLSQVLSSLPLHEKKTNPYHTAPHIMIPIDQRDGGDAMTFISTDFGIATYDGRVAPHWPGSAISWGNTVCMWVMVWGGARVDDFWNGRGEAGRVHLAIVLYCTDRSTDLAISQQTQVSRKPRTDTQLFSRRKKFTANQKKTPKKQYTAAPDAKNGTDG